MKKKYKVDFLGEAINFMESLDDKRKDLLQYTKIASNQ